MPRRWPRSGGLPSSGPVDMVGQPRGLAGGLSKKIHQGKKVGPGCGPVDKVSPGDGPVRSCPSGAADRKRSAP